MYDSFYMCPSSFSAEPPNSTPPSLKSVFLLFCTFCGAPCCRERYDQLSWYRIQKHYRIPWLFCSSSPLSLNQSPPFPLPHLPRMFPPMSFLWQGLSVGSRHLSSIHTLLAGLTSLGSQTSVHPHTAAGKVFVKHRSDHAIALLKALQWLPKAFRIQFNLVSLVRGPLPEPD